MFGLNNSLWCVAMVLVAVSPLLADVQVRWIALVAGLGLVVGAVLGSLRGSAADRYLPVAVGLTLIVGAIVASTSHRSLALSWVGGLLLGLLAAAPFFAARRSARSGNRAGSTGARP